MRQGTAPVPPARQRKQKNRKLRPPGARRTPQNQFEKEMPISIFSFTFRQGRLPEPKSEPRLKFRNAPGRDGGRDPSGKSGPANSGRKAGKRFAFCENIQPELFFHQSAGLFRLPAKGIVPATGRCEVRSQTPVTAAGIHPANSDPPDRTPPLGSRKNPQFPLRSSARACAPFTQVCMNERERQCSPLESSGSAKATGIPIPGRRSSMETTIRKRWKNAGFP